MCRNVFAVLTQHLLDVVNDAALYTGYICDENARFEIFLVFCNPFFENMRIKCENHQIRFPDHFRIGCRGSFRYDVIVKGILNGIGIAVNRTKIKTIFGKTFCVTSSDKSKPYD